ncbi:MAG: outer membrane protein assembly factor BamA [Alphaproteobacteria bacterium]|nr:outer membrane protein assembly factor BamA [Alphaproteobacteria bacterium]
MRLIYRLFIGILALAVIAPLSAYAQTLIREIHIQGAERIEPETIQSYMDIKVGDPMTREMLDAGLKSLFATGLFADVTLSQQGSALVVDVLENPVINQIAFEGNDKIEDSALLAEIQMRPRQVFTRTRVQSDVSRLYQVYRRSGRFSVGIEPKVIKLDQNRIDLVFEIQEGDVTKVESIRFVGNKRFDDDRLRREISTKESAWYRFISSDDRYDPDRMAYDQELLRRFYLAHGYADFRILSAVSELSDERDRFFMTFTVEEGKRYRVGEVSINSQLRNFEPSVLRPEINIKTGEWYNADYVQESIDNLTNALGDRQYAFVNVRPDVQRNREENTVDLVFNIDETPRVFVERIEVNGNMRTLDKVVRREFELVEGYPFNKSKLAKSEQNIRNLDFFETAEVTTKPGSAPDKTVVEVDVSEKSTGELSIGAGFSTNDGPLADFRIRERNLLGKGQDLSLATVVAGKRTEFDVSFTEPYFLDRDVSAGFSAFHMTRDYQDESSYDQRRTGGGVHMGYPLSERWRQGLRYRMERNEITDVQSDASRFIRGQEGKRDTSALSQSLTYDSRDSTIFPTEGLLYWLNAEVAGLGGDAKYVSGKTGVSYYYPVFDQVVLNAMAETGIIEGYSDTDVQINERYYLGGSTLRGFESAGVGPRDLTTGDALGGQVFYRGTLESSFPIGLPSELGISGHVFGDVGTLTELDDNGPEIQDEASLRASLGFGLSWRSPFGPVRADFAVPVSKEDFDQEEHFRFTFGTRF